MTDWVYKDGSYRYTLKNGDPIYQAYLYAFLVDNELTGTEIVSCKNREMTIFSKDNIPQYQEFAKKISPASKGMADANAGKTITFGLRIKESLDNATYVLEMIFNDYYDPKTGIPETFSFLEREDIIERICNTARAYAAWTK